MALTGRRVLSGAGWKFKQGGVIGDDPQIMRQVRQARPSTDLSVHKFLELLGVVHLGIED